MGKKHPSSPKGKNKAKAAKRAKQPKATNSSSSDQDLTKFDSTRIIRVPLAPRTVPLKTSMPNTQKDLLKVIKDSISAISALSFFTGRVHGNVTADTMGWYYRRDGTIQGVLDDLDIPPSRRDEALKERGIVPTPKNFQEMIEMCKTHSQNQYGKGKAPA